MNKLIILQTVLPDYRKRFFQYIVDSLGKDFKLFGGKEYFESSLKTDESINFINQTNNYFFLGRRFLLQSGMWKECIKTQVLILEMNPRIISNWLLLFLRRLLNKKTVLWGHAWPRKGQQSKSDSIRNLMRLMADTIIVYTNTQAQELKEKMPGKKIIAAPNAVYFKDEMRVLQIPKQDICNIIYVGRLTKAKKPLDLVKAYISVLNKLPKETNLIIVGDGEEKESILELVKKMELTDRIILMGHIGEYNRLEKLYSESLLSTSPGYIGLSVTQSFSFGVPMLVSKDENHSPEIEAVKAEENAIFFESNDIDDLGRKLLDYFAEKDYWIEKRSHISDFCRKNYSVESMAENFIALT